MAQKISKEEYEAQRSEYTKASLKNLQKELETEKVFSEADGDNDSTEDDDDKEVPNLLVQSYYNKGKKDSSAILALLIAQRELDHNKLEKMSKHNYTNKLEMEKSDMKLHYARLELNNANVKCDSLRDKIKKLDMDLLKEKTGRHNEFMTTIVMKILFILLVLFDFYRVIMW